MKKALIFIVLICFTFGLLGCNSNQKSDKNTTSIISEASSSSNVLSSMPESFNAASFIDETLKSLTDRNGQLISDPSGNCARIKAEIETRIKVLFKSALTLQYEDSQYVKKANGTIYSFKCNDFTFSIAVSDKNSIMFIMILADSEKPSDDFLMTVTATLMLSDIGLTTDEADRISDDLIKDGTASTDDFLFYLDTDGSAEFQAIPLRVGK